MTDKNIHSTQGFGFVTIDNEKIKENILMSPYHLINKTKVKCFPSYPKKLLIDHHHCHNILQNNKNNEDYKRKVIISNVPLHYTIFELNLFFKYYYGEITQCLLIKDINEDKSHYIIKSEHESTITKVVQDKHERYFHGNCIKYKQDTSKESLLEMFDILINNKSFLHDNNPLSHIILYDSNEDNHSNNKPKKQTLLTCEIFVTKPDKEFNCDIQLPKLERQLAHCAKGNDKSFTAIVSHFFNKLSCNDTHSYAKHNNKGDSYCSSIYKKDNKSSMMNINHSMTNESRKINSNLNMNGLNKKNMLNDLHYDDMVKINHYLKYKLFDINGDIIHINENNNHLQIYPNQKYKELLLSESIDNKSINKPVLNNSWINKPSYTYQILQQYPHPIISRFIPSPYPNIYYPPRLYYNDNLFNNINQTTQCLNRSQSNAYNESRQKCHLE